MVKQIPNLFTLLNLVFGCMACVAALQPGIIMAADNNGQLYYDVPEQIWLASLFIMAGAIVDYFDGLLARLLKASSAMGRELDSLSDVVSFGVAPSLILYQFLRLSWAVACIFTTGSRCLAFSKIQLESGYQFVLLFQRIACSCSGTLCGFASTRILGSEPSLGACLTAQCSFFIQCNSGVGCTDDFSASHPCF
jgi:phosphatidylglycerophosphate synthase